MFNASAFGKNFQLHAFHHRKLLLFLHAIDSFSPKFCDNLQKKTSRLTKLQTNIVKSTFFFHPFLSFFPFSVSFHVDFEKPYSLEVATLFYTDILEVTRSTIKYKLIFSTFTDATQYAHYVFSTIKKNPSGKISFEVSFNFFFSLIITSNN